MTRELGGRLALQSVLILRLGELIATSRQLHAVASIAACALQHNTIIGSRHNHQYT
jgi:hypothetical protein